MDVALLAGMVAELITDHDQVGLPGVGTFVAEVVPATFSDRGYTINPPYRRLSFHPSRTEDSLLIDFYAASNGITKEAASAYLTQFLQDLKSVLKERKTIVLPGLGRLRATVENNFFFVPDPDLDIFPDGFALKPLSLKTIPENPENPGQAEMPAKPESVVEAEPEPVVEPVAEPVSEPEAEEEEAPECPEYAEPLVEAEPVVEPVPEPVIEPEAESVTEVEPETESVEVEVVEDAGEGEWRTGEESAPKRRSFRWWIPLFVLLVVAAVAILAFIIVAQVAPDFIDSILYTPEELRIINY